MSRNQMSYLKLSLKAVLLTAIIFIGCKDDEPAPGCTNATLRDATGLDGCGWIIELADGSRLEPINLEDFEVNLEDGTQVCIEYKEQADLASICMVGPIIEITSLVEGTRID